MDRVVSTIFCDDIRLEVGNKISLIGTYQGFLYVSHFPTILPKLCVLVTIRTPIHTLLKNVSVRILKGDQVLAELPIDKAIFENESPPALPDDPKNHLQIFSTPIVFTPFVVDGPTILRVRVDADGEELKGPGLIIEKASAPPDKA